ncbi:MAG: leucine-rich repeat domain-containing protein [Bacilli bacterium]|nr:leucine-rich repeat domain-containing protein [Bacilli bacterium]MDD3422238.1 leucine-rich repeat domain-containing protein [Bacilli bacterium]MDD4065836.1 leucine-rich repeat domain-containing protein [Bacilli bacterium]
MRKYKKDSTLVWAARVCIYLCCILFLNTETLALAIAALILILGFEVINQISKRYSKMEEIAEKQKELLEKQVKQQEHKTNIIMEIKNLIVQISDQKEKRRKSLVSKIGCLGRPSNKENALLKEIFAFEQLEFGVYSIVKYKGFNERIIKIPKTYRGMKIVGIGDCAFEDCTSLQRIEIEASILFVGKRAFSNCRNLKDILLPGCIETIGDKAFYLCKKLRRCGYSDNVTLLGNPFENSGISSLVFPRTMHEIPNCFLRGCSNINEITIPGFI